MVKMDGEAWAAWGVLALGVVGALGGTIRNALHTSFKNGYFTRGHEELAKKVERLEERQRVTEQQLSEIKIIQLKVDNIQTQVRNLRRDIIRLLRGKIKNVDTLERVEDEDDIES